MAGGMASFIIFVVALDLAALSVVADVTVGALAAGCAATVWAACLVVALGFAGRGWGDGFVAG